MLFDAKTFGKKTRKAITTFYLKSDNISHKYRYNYDFT